MGMLEPGHARRPGAVRADAARRLQANLLRHRVGRREGTEGDEEGHHARPGSGRRRGLCRRRDQSGGILHRGSLYVTLFAGSAVVALDPTDGAQVATHTVPAGPAVISVDEKDRVVVAGTRGQVTYLDGTQLPAGTGYALALAGGSMWTEDYERAELVRVPDGHRVGLPLPLFPFWLAPGGPGRLLISAEGGDEDVDSGGVFSLDTGSETFTTLARPRDPDQVVEYATKVLVAAHGDKEVLAIDGEKISVWASGMPAVALAPDAALNLLAVVVNDHE